MNKSNLNATEIIKRAKSALKVKKDTELAEFLGITSSSLYQFKKRNQFPPNLIIQLITKHFISANWLIFGVGPKFYNFEDGKIKESPVREISDILEDIKEFIGVKTDKDLCSYFNVTPSVVSSWKERGCVPYKTLLTFCSENDIDSNELLLGNVRKPTPETTTAQPTMKSHILDLISKENFNYQISKEGNKTKISLTVVIEEPTQSRG